MMLAFRVRLLCFLYQRLLVEIGIDEVVVMDMVLVSLVLLRI